MAFNERQIFATDFRPDVAIGLDLPFNAEGVFRSTYQSKDALKNNLINYLLTNPGERVGNPNFGAGLRNFVFEQITEENLDFLEDKIQDDIRNNIPNINLQQVSVTANEDNNQITVGLFYSIGRTGITDSVDITFS
jgi:phage baseplate assembly protein W